jgi:hypothetical protein
MADAKPAHVRYDVVVAVIALLSLPLFFYGLGDTYLWQDEAQTALLGRSVLAHGVPMVGLGSDSISAVEGKDAGIGGMYFQVSWLQAYVAAASLKLFGESSWSARLPFAMCGWLCIPLGAWVLRTSGATQSAARMYALLMAFSVPFIVCSRQARYYALAAALTLVAVGTYAALTGPMHHVRRTMFSVLFAISASLLSVSFDITAVAVLGTLALHWLLASRPHEERVARLFWSTWSVACLVLAAWFAASFTAPSRHEDAGLASLPNRLRHGVPYYVGQINSHVVPLPAFLTLATLRRRSVAGVRREHLDGLRRSALLLGFVAVGGSLGAMLPPVRFFRYVVPVFPVLIGLVAIGLASVWSWGRLGKTFAAAAIVALVTSNALFVWSHSALTAIAKSSGLVAVRERPIEHHVPMLLLLQEFRDPPRGSIAAVVDYLGAHARPNDVIVTSYGELSLRFHTGLQVFGGETAQLPPDNTQADWLWPRHLKVFPQVRAAVEWIERQITEGDYRRIELPVVDRQWENREDPEEHIFANPGPDGPPVVLYKAAE